MIDGCTPKTKIIKFTVTISRIAIKTNAIIHASKVLAGLVFNKKEKTIADTISIAIEPKMFANPNEIIIYVFNSISPINK